MTLSSLKGDTRICLWETASETRIFLSRPSCLRREAPAVRPSPRAGGAIWRSAAAELSRGHRAGSPKHDHVCIRAVDGLSFIRSYRTTNRWMKRHDGRESPFLSDYSLLVVASPALLTTSRFCSAMASQQPPHLDAQVLIIGGGIGGLTLAAICRKIGISCKVLERTKELTPVGAGISLAPNALRVLDQLGIYRSIVEEGQRLRKIQVHRNRTKWSEIDFEWLEPTFGYPVYSIERHQFHHLLYAAAGGSDAVLLDADVTDIVDDPTQPGVTVKLSDGRSLVGEAAVGADGIRSATRRILARQAGLDSVNTIRFTGRVHMSGYTAPLTNLGPAEIGVANWLLFDNTILTTWPCKDNRQWYIGVKVGPRAIAWLLLSLREKSLSYCFRMAARR